MDHRERALAEHRDGFNCAQAVLAGFAEELGMDLALARRIATPFGGGLSMGGDLCGAVSGGLMVIGLRYGRAALEDLAAKERSYALGRRFVAEFTTRFGSATCRDLLGVDVGTPDGLAAFRERNCHGTVCPDFVKGAVEILEGLLAQG